MKRTHARTRQLKTAVSVYDPSKRSRPSHCVRKGHRSRVSRCLGGAPYHHYSFGNSEVFFVSLSLLSFCFVIIIKYSRAQRGTQASYPHHHPSLLL